MAEQSLNLEPSEKNTVTQDEIVHDNNPTEKSKKALKSKAPNKKKVSQTILILTRLLCTKIVVCQNLELKRKMRLDVVFVWVGCIPSVFRIQLELTMQVYVCVPNAE